MCADEVCYTIGSSMSRLPASRLRRYCLVVIVIAVLCSTASVAQVAGGTQSEVDSNVTVNDISITDNVIASEDDVDYVAGWKPSTINTTINGSSGTYTVCAKIGPPGERHELSCDETSLEDGENKTLTFTNTSWTQKQSGEQTITIVVQATNETSTPDPGSELAKETHQVHILPEGGDLDGDGLVNSKEVDLGADPRKKDTDQDNLLDNYEANLHSDPNKKDTDGDGLGDGKEVNKHKSSPIKKDTDGDKLPDQKEVNIHGTLPDKPDSDGDGLTDRAEVIKHKTEPREPDSDGDGLSDSDEVNLHGTDPNNRDSDQDGVEDKEEVDSKTSPNARDSDGDGLLDGEEMNKYGTKPTKRDTDEDGVDDRTEIERGTSPTGGLLGLVDPSINPMGTMIGGLSLVALAGGLALYWRYYRKTDADEDEAADAASETDNTMEAVTDEDRIWQLLDQNGGRLPQSEIVTETGWSKSKVSRLLTRMEDDDQITKINIGRENLITRSGDEPEHAGSALDG